MTIAQQPRHRAAGAQGFGREPHPSGPIVPTPRRAASHRGAETAAPMPAPLSVGPVAPAVVDEPLTAPIPRAALDAARSRPMPAAPMAPFAPGPVGSPPVGGTGAAAPRRRRRWPWVVGGLFLLIVIIGSTNRTSTTPAVATPAPAVAAGAAAPAAVASTVTLPSDVVGRNAQIVSGELTGLGLTNVTFASRDAEDTVVVLLQNWTVTGIEPGAGTSVAPGDAVVVTVTKAGAAGAPAAAPAATSPAAGPASSFGDGTHVVGQDIQAGTYKTAGPSTSSFGACYWARLSNTSGEFDAIITNGVPTGQATVTVRSGDAAFETSGCQTWTKVN